jgi:hypothetical protein
MEGLPVRRYRYRTPALTGPWRDCAEDALRDAVSAKQAVVQAGQSDGVRWIVPGTIEEESDVSAAG